MKTVDVSYKFDTLRSAQAYGRIRISKETVELIKSNSLPKGNLLEASRIAGLYGAKRTSDLLPFCHPVPIDFIAVWVKVGESFVEVFSKVSGISRTGYEMEALTAVSVALLNIYDMCKAFDKNMVIEEIRLQGKAGGKSEWSGSLKGRKVFIDQKYGDASRLIAEYVEKLGACIVEDREISDLMVMQPPCDIVNELRNMEIAFAVLEFRVDPLLSLNEVRFGKDNKGTTVICLPADNKKVEIFFRVFGDFLGNLL